jgi:hypothetical protein
MIGPYAEIHQIFGTDTRAFRPLPAGDRPARMRAVGGESAAGNSYLYFQAMVACGEARGYKVN